MAATSFSAVSWSPSEIITDEKMQQFSDNVQWVYDNTPRALYTLPNGLIKPTGVRFIGGMTGFGRDPSNDRAQIYVGFGSAFSVGCVPIITIGINNTFQTKVAHRFSGGAQLLPDHTGFGLYVQVMATQASQDFIEQAFFVHWIAMGW